MKYPKINRQPRRLVTVPKLSGGLNLRDSLTTVSDNQMTDCVNMWFKNGMLQTRPSFVTNSEKINFSGNIKVDKSIDTHFHDEIKIFYNSVECILATNKIYYFDKDNVNKYSIEFEFQGKEKSFSMPDIMGFSDKDITYFCTEMSGVLYCYISDCTVWKLEYNKPQEDNEKLEWIKIDRKDAYVPTVYVHCQRSGWDDFEGTFFEGYNLIGDRYKMIYSAYNENDSDTSHPMRYALGNKLPKSGEITVEITSYDASAENIITVEHKISYTEEQYNQFTNGVILIEKFENNAVPEDGLYLFVKYNYVGFLFESEFTYVSGIATIDTDDKRKKYACNEDNVVIYAPYIIDENSMKKVFCMTNSTWFGGASFGINGGSRLFLCGNTEANEKSLVVWSGLNEPLYFGENCYAYIGSKSRAVTAFGRQGESLIVFKENKIYAAYYNQNTSINADSLINQVIVDYDANSTYFTFILVNGSVGCDCPNTIQMCRNRLVWASSEGKVYTLCNTNQYNEHTVYELSDMIMPKLKEYRDRLKTATSADFNGHYVLFLENCAFVMDYCSYGYQYIYSYSKSDDANTLIPWYFWEFDFLKNEHQGYKYSNARICVLDDEIIMRAYFVIADGEDCAFVGFSINEKSNSGFDYIFNDEIENGLPKIVNSKINCRLATRMFELGSGIYYATVDKVVVKAGTNNEIITVHLVSDQGEETIIIKDKHDNADIQSKTFVRSKAVHPCVRNVVRFGIKFECEGRLCIEGLSINYKLLGGVK